MTNYRKDMKKIVFVLMAGLALAACHRPAGKEAAVPAEKEVAVRNGVEVLYFHGKQRCATCMAIESHTKAVLEEHFAEQMKKGDVVFKVIDISKPENEKLAEQYEVSWSSLFVVKHQNGKETRENMTEFAFGHARKAPDKFEAGVVKAVDEMLK